MLGNVKDIGENGLKPASQSREYKYIFNLWLHSCMRILIISYKRVHDKCRYNYFYQCVSDTSVLLLYYLGKNIFNAVIKNIIGKVDDI